MKTLAHWIDRLLGRPVIVQPLKKAQVFQFKNPAHWKLERARRKARGTL